MGSVPGPVLFDDYSEEWLEAQRVRLRPSTSHNYEALTRRYLLPHLRGVFLNDITTRSINRTYAVLLDHGGRNGASLSPATVRMCHTVLSRMLASATLSGFIDRNHALGAAVPGPDLRPSPHNPKTWTMQELSEFLCLIKGHRHEVLFRLAAATGMRRGELLALPWDEVDLCSGTIRVRWAISDVRGHVTRYQPKTRRPRVLTIDATTAHLLARHRLRCLTHPRPDPRAVGAHWNLVLTGHGGGVLPPDAASRAFRTFLRQAELRRIRFHDLRHTHAAVLLAQGTSLHVVSARLGHSWRVTLMYYAHVLPPSDQAAAAHWSELVDHGSVPRHTSSNSPPHAEAATWTEAAASMPHNLWAWKKKAAWKQSTARDQGRIPDTDPH